MSFLLIRLLLLYSILQALDVADAITMSGVAHLYPSEGTRDALQKAASQAADNKQTQLTVKQARRTSVAKKNVFFDHCHISLWTASSHENCL